MPAASGPHFATLLQQIIPGSKCCTLLWLFTADNHDFCSPKISFGVKIQFTFSLVAKMIVKLHSLINLKK
jgi:hypothetical protein